MAALFKLLSSLKHLDYLAEKFSHLPVKFPHGLGISYLEKNEIISFRHVWRLFINFICYTVQTQFRIDIVGNISLGFTGLMDKYAYHVD